MEWLERMTCTPDLSDHLLQQITQVQGMLLSANERKAALLGNLFSHSDGQENIEDFIKRLEEEYADAGVEPEDTGVQVLEVHEGCDHYTRESAAVLAELNHQLGEDLAQLAWLTHQ